MKNLEKLMKTNNLLMSYTILYAEFKKQYYDNKLDLTFNEFDILDEFMNYVQGILEETMNIEAIPKTILNEFDKLTIQK